MTIDEIKEKLTSKKSADRKRGAKEIGKIKAVELGDFLFEKYLIERNDTRTWETQCEMIKALGLLNYTNAISEIELIVKNNIPHDMITTEATIAFVRLKRKNINDGKPVLELLKFGSVSVICGALEVLAIDQMLPDDETIKDILLLSWDINKHKDRVGYEYGLIDSRKYLAIACANWSIELTRDFLNHCIETACEINSFGKSVQDDNLIAVCQNSLKGKFSKSYL